VLPFWLSIAALSLVQAATVLGPSRRAVAALARLRSPWWAVIPPLSVLAFVLIGRLAEHASGQALTYLALIAVPPLAALALGWGVWEARGSRASAAGNALGSQAVAAERTGGSHPAVAGRAGGSHPAAALLVLPLFALAWAMRSSLAGEAAAVALSALSCVTLGVLLGTVTPARWLALGIVLMAVADTALVVSDLLQRPNDVLNAAHPAAHLPRLQSASFGDAVMGYGDLFVAGLLGGLLAAAGDRARQLWAALLVAGLALGFDLLFFLVDELPATVPVALVTIILCVGSRARR
jgi:hypothetical protein